MSKKSPLLSTFASIVAILALPISAATTRANTPDPLHSTATCSPSALHIAPDGTGPSLADVGATITVTVIMVDDVPVPGYPFQDIWVSGDASNSVRVCQGGSVADGNTNIDGVTTISGAIAGGGSSQNGLRLYLAGAVLDGVTLPIRVNSPDYNGDLSINMLDLGDFAADYLNSSYDFTGDFNHDGVEDLVDLGIFTEHFFQGSCP